MSDRKNVQLFSFLFSILAAAVSSCARVDENNPAAHEGPAYINSELAPPLGPYASAVRAGDLVFVSGVLGFDYENGRFESAEIETQTERAFDNLEAVLSESGAGLGDVVKITVFLRTPQDMAGMNAVYERRVGDRRPARTLVPGADWGREEILIEIDAVAYCGRCE